MARAHKNKGRAEAEDDFEEDDQRSGPGVVDAESDAEAEEGAKKTYKKYPTMIVGISKTRKELHEAVGALADKLGCKTSDLVWVGLERVLKDPPKDMPKGATINAGSAPGFWVVPVTSSNGRATEIKVVEVNTRAQIDTGRTFFRYDRNDTEGKSRARAQKQAVASAMSDAKLAGIKVETIKVEKA